MKHRGIAFVVALVLGLSGCASPALSPSSGPSDTADSASRFTGVGLADRAASDLPLSPGEGAQSLTIDFSCEGGGPFQVEYGDGMAQGWGWLTGVCDGAHTWTMRADALTPVLHIAVPEGVEWSAEATFSPDPYQADAALEQDCDAYSSAYSGFVNADTGFGSYAAFGADEWTTRVDAAAAELEQVRARSTTALAEPFGEVLAHVTDPTRVVGQAMTEPLDAVTTISEACQANGSEIHISAEFGG